MLAALAAATTPGRARAARRLHELPQPGPPRQAGRHDRRDRRRPADPRPRRRLERDGVPGVRLPVRPPHRPVRGGVHDHPDAAPRGRDRLRRALLPGPRLRAAAARRGRGGPPLLIGSNGERMLRITAPHVDAWNTWYADTEQHARRASRRSATSSTRPARDVGRDPGRDRADRRGPRPDAGRHRPDDGRQRPRRRTSRRSRARRRRWPRSCAPTPRAGSARSSSSSTRSTAPSIERFAAGPARSSIAAE